MSLTKTTTVDQITVTENGTVLYREFCSAVALTIRNNLKCQVDTIMHALLNH